MTTESNGITGISTKATALIGGLTDVGRSRTINEDRFVIAPSGCLFILADGMGGHKGGETASTLALDSIQQMMGEVLATLGERSPDDVALHIEQAVLAAHEKIQQKASQNPELEGMGTTIVVALRQENTLFLCNVGDSRAYRIDTQGIRLITKDHSFVMAQVDAGLITLAEAQVSALKNRLTQALGSPFAIQPYSAREDLRGSGWILLCSDGLWDMLTDEKIQAIALRHTDAQELCQALVQAANQAGGKDNITAVIFRFGNDASTEPSTETIPSISLKPEDEPERLNP